MDRRTGMKTIWVGLLLAGVLVTPARAETVTYLHTDLLGSVVLETDQNRNVVARYEYEPYGLPRQAIADAPGYTGHVHDAGSGLVYMQQRYYDAEVGQFLSVDPMPSDTTTGWNFNRYNYAANNPYTFVDPDGRVVEKPWEDPWRQQKIGEGPPNDPMGGPCGTGKACWSAGGGGGENQGRTPEEEEYYADRARRAELTQETLEEAGIFAVKEFVAMLGVSAIGTRLRALVAARGTARSVGAAATHKVPRAGVSAKEAAKDVPSWATGERPVLGEKGRDFAKRILDGKYGPGQYPKGPGSEFSKIQKWGDRAFQNPPGM